MATQAIQMRLELGEEERFEVVSVRLREGLSRPVDAEVEIASEGDVDFDRALLGDATLTLLRGDEEARRWTLKVGKVRFRGMEHGSTRYAVELHDSLFPLGLVSNTRKFRDRTVDAIVTQVLDEARVRCAWRTTDALASRPFTVQYREITRDFVLRLLASEGVYHSFDPDGTVVLGDASSSAAPVPGQAHFELQEAGGALDRGEPGIHEIRKGRRLLPGAVTLDDSNWKKPSLSLVQSAVADRDADLEVYDYPGGFRDPKAGERGARIRLESLRVRALGLEGRSDVAAFAPGLAFAFGGSAGPFFEGEYVLVAVEHSFYDRRFSTRPGDAASATTYESRFEAVPRSVPFRPPQRPRPTVAGHHTAIVRGPAGAEIHTDAHGRFKAQFHWDREATGTDADSRWMRMLQESSTSMFLARTGWEMTVGYIDGDPDRPVGLARNINGLMTPAYAQPASKAAMAIKTPSSPATGGFNEIKLDDSAGGQRFDLRAERDLRGLVKHDQTETIGANETHVVGASLTRTVDRDLDVEIARDAIGAVNGDVRVHVQRDRACAVGRDERIGVGGAQSLTTNGNERERVGSLRMTIAGSASTEGLAGMAKALVPTPRSAVASIFGGARAGVAAPVESATAAAQGAAGAPLSAVAGFGAIGAAAGPVGKALAAKAAVQGAQQAAHSVKAGVEAAKKLPSAVKGALSGAGAKALAGAKNAALSQLRSLVPSRDAVLAALLHGSIERKADKGLRRSVGGGFIGVAVGDVTTNAGLGHAEIVGGAKVTVSGGDVTEKVGAALATTVGGAILRTSTGPMSFKALSSSVSVGGAGVFVSEQAIEIHGGTVTLRAGAGLTFDAGDVLLDMAPGKLALEGEVTIDASASTKLAGASLDVTKG